MLKTALRVCCMGLCVLFAAASGGVLPPKMRDTKVSSSPANYDKLAAEATKLGWANERSEGKSEGKYFWMLKVMPVGGGKLYFTKNNSTGGVAFSCDGVGDCEGAANKLLGPAFGGQY